MKRQRETATEDVIRNRNAANTVEFRPTSKAMPRLANAATKEYGLQALATVALRSSFSVRSELSGKDESLHELADSIAKSGIIAPIVVRKSKPGVFAVIAGERRLAAAKLLSLRTVPCIVRECSDGEALMISLAENLQRNDLNPIERATALERLLEDFAFTQEEVGKRIGMSQSAIAHHLRLLALPEAVQRLIAEGTLSFGHGKLIAKIDDEQEAIDLALMCIAENKSVRALETLLAGEPVKRSRPLHDPAKKTREDRELPNGVFLVIKENLREQPHSGTIEIPFYSREEKEWILQVLSTAGPERDKRTQAASPRAS